MINKVNKAHIWHENEWFLCDFKAHLGDYM